MPSHSTTHRKMFLLTLLLTAVSAYKTVSNIAIIGGGTSGCLLASRLCRALPSSNILLLERAPPRSEEAEFLVRSPRNVFAAWNEDELAETIETDEDDGLDGRSSQAIAPQTLGGGSSINALSFTTPTGGSFGLGRRRRRARSFAAEVFDEVGFDEPDEDEKQIYAEDYIDAAEDAGFKLGGALFEGEVNRVFNNRIAVQGGRRVDSCEAFLTPALAKCKNLELRQGAIVTKLLFSKRKRVVGLRYVNARDKTDVTDIGVDEVIVAAGPYGSPQLLQLSGIGPEHALKRIGIKVVADLPVGMKVQGRVLVPFKSLYDEDIEPANDPDELTEEARAEWEENGTGVFAKSVYAINAQLKDAYIVGTFVGTTPRDVGKKVVTSFCLPNPTSFGTLFVKTKNVFDGLKIRLNLLGDKKEIPSILRCLQRVARIHARFDERFNLTTILPEGELNERYVRHNALFANQFVGGCAQGSVVDSRWRVKKVKGVRVVDASVLQRLPQSAGPYAATYVVAAAAAEDLTNEFRKRERAKWW